MQLDSTASPHAPHRRWRIAVLLGIGVLIKIDRAVDLRGKPLG